MPRRARRNLPAAAQLASPRPTPPGGGIRHAARAAPRTGSSTLVCMHCLACRYALTGLSVPRCPECGRAFDPRDPSTYAVDETQRRPRWPAVLAIAGLAWPVLVHGWLYATLVAGRLVLGRWPSPSGADDPKYIPVVASMHLVALLAVMFTPLAMIGGFYGLGVVALRNWRAGLGCGAAVWVAYMGAGVLGDPAKVWVWFWD